MKGTILEKIFESKLRRVEAAKSAINTAELLESATQLRAGLPSNRLHAALSRKTGANLIAEFKKASPSKGIINDRFLPTDAARAYESGGAAAISVLTEEDHFNGTIDDLKAVRRATSLPILRKDFIFDPFQIYEAAAAGADAILLIAAMLEDKQLRDLKELAENELGLDALVEVHSLVELDRAAAIGATMIGVNNRDLRSFVVSLDVSRQLVKHSPRGALLVAESGLSSPAEISELQELGYAGFLIGEALMTSSDPSRVLRSIVVATASRSLAHHADPHEVPQ